MGGLTRQDDLPFGCQSATDMNYEVNIRTKRCILRKPLPISRFSFGICSYGEYIIVVSGLIELT